MGHLGAKDVYRRLGQQIDSLQFRAPWNETFAEILSELYSPEDAHLLVKMPTSLSTLDELARATGHGREQLRRQLDNLCDRGLVMDVMLGGEYRYVISPLIIGIFEMTMMRTDDGYDPAKMARLFHEYFDTGEPFRANFGAGERSTPARAIPHEQTFRDGAFAEVLDYDKATSIVEAHDTFSLGICACRHEHHHLGDKECDDPLELCTSMGAPADYLVRRNLAKQISKGQMLEHLARSRERGLVLCGDNVQRKVSFICQCCRCCCGILEGIRKHGYIHAAASSSFIARSDDETCKGCNHCEKACPIDAIRMVPDNDPGRKRKKRPQVDEEICLGCGVCVLKCRTGAMKLDPRPQRVIPPETTFHRVLLMALDRGTLQNIIFDHPEHRSHRYLRALVGGFLKLSPVKRSLMSDQLRSRFLKLMESAARAQGRSWILTEI